MAFIVHCGRCRLSATRCGQLVSQWQQAADGLGADAARQALARLPGHSSEGLALLGMADAAYARGWLASGRSGTSMALSLQMLQWTTHMSTLPAEVWHAMVNDAAGLALPAGMARRIAAGPTLARWLGALTARPIHSPADAHLGRWVPGRTALRLMPYLRPAQADVRHDCIRSMLHGLTAEDWLLVNPVW